MKKFTVEITETLQRQIEVEAEDENEAISKAEDMYRNEEVVLDSGDYIDTDFNIIDKNGEKVGEKLPTEITVTLDDLSLDCLDNVNEVEEAISNYLLDTYGYYSDNHEWECGDDVNTIDVYNIEWDTTKK